MKIRLLKTTKSLVAKVLNKKTASFLRLIINYIYDFQRFNKFSAISAKGILNIEAIKNQTNLKALITMEYHRIEKALSLKETRATFGVSTVERLINGIDVYQGLYGSDELIQVAVNNLVAYHNFNCQHGNDDQGLYKKLVSFKNKIDIQHNNYHEKNLQGGVIRISKLEVLSKAKIDLKDFFNCRHSIRNFTEEVVDLKLIEQAVEMAQKTPSVCNRQSSKVYVFSNSEDKKMLLNYQNGNAGFGHLVSKVLIVTSDLQNFVSVGERNQCWIDGGMYAMSLVYALHSLGLGTCCLNWSVEYQIDTKLRYAAGISDSEAVIMMIAVGHLPEELMVAQSPRKKIDEVMIVK